MQRDLPTEFDTQSWFSHLRPGDLAPLNVMGLGETLHLSSHKYTGPLSIVKIAKVCTVVVVKGENCLRK